MTNKDQNNVNELISCITLYVLFGIITIGSVSSICNIIIFSSREFRYNSCGFYLLCSTIFDLSYLWLSGITRLLNDHYSSILSDKSKLYCKYRTYLVVVFPSLSISFLMLASIDRFLSTSTKTKWRHFSQIKIAWRVSILTLIISLLYNYPVVFLYKSERKNVNINVYKCVPNGGFYTNLITICLLLNNPFIMYAIMFICTIITLIRIRRSRCRMGFINNCRRKHGNIDRHLITILFIQVGLGILLTIFRCGFLVYSFWTRNQNKNLSRINF